MKYVHNLYTTTELSMNNVYETNELCASRHWDAQKKREEKKKRVTLSIIHFHFFLFYPVIVECIRWNCRN